MIKRAIGRLLLVPIGLVLAAVMAMLVISTLGLERVTQEMHRQGGGGGLEGISWLAQFGLKALSALTGFGSVAAIVPVLIVIVVGEVGRIRSSLYYILGGGVALAIIPFLARLGGSAQAAMPPAFVWQVLATAGFAAGFVYWLVAGRSA
jgi:hypothetical protein